MHKVSNENVQYEKKRFGKVVPTKGVDYFTNAEKEEMTEDVIEQVEEDLNFTETINGINNSISNLENNKVDKQQGKGLSTNDFTNQYKQQIDDNKANISTINQNLANYSLISETGSILQLNMNSTTYKISAVLKDKNGNTISTSNEIDLPLESVVVSGTYDSTNKKIVLVLENGNTIDVPVGDLINGLQSEITSQNKLDSDLVDDTNSSNKFVSSAEKQAWNNKAEASDIPTKMSELTNDDNFVKDANYVHTDNNYTSDEKNKLSGIESGSQKNVIEKISVNGIEQTIKADKSVDIRIDNRKKYTIKRQYANNTSSEWERMDDAVGLVANATHDGTSVTNDFDNIYPWSEIKKHIYNFDTKQVVAEYGDVNYIEDVVCDLRESVEIAKKAGVSEDRIMIDPGVGFAKSYEQNLEIINKLDELCKLNPPILLGTSRKSVIGLTLNLPSSERVEGTVATSVIGAMKGARFFRVHDIKENRRALDMTRAILS